MPTIRIRGLDRTIEAETGTDLLKTCREGHVNVFWGPWAKVLNCRGKGFCNLCTVEVLEGQENLSPRTKRESKRLKNKPDTWRLACCAQVQGDIVVDTFPVRHAGDHASPEAIHRATLPEEERGELEKQDWLALKEDPKPRDGAPKKGLLAKLRKQKGIDDSDLTPDAGEGLKEEEAAGGAKPKKGFLGKRKGDKSASETPEKAKGKKEKGARKKAVLEESPVDVASEAESSIIEDDANEEPSAPDASARKQKKKFGLKR